MYFIVCIAPIKDKGLGESQGEKYLYSNLKLFLIYTYTSPGQIIIIISPL